MQSVNKELLRQEMEKEKDRKTSEESIFLKLKYPASDKETVKKKIRILPPCEGLNGLPYYNVWLHYGLVGKNGEKRVYVCTKGTEGYCPICSKVNELAKNKDTKKLSSDLKAVCVYLYNVLDVDDGFKSKIFVAKPSQHKEIRAEILEMETDITNLDTGSTLQIARLHDDPWCRLRNLGESALTEEVKKQVIIRDLAKVYITNTAEELKRALNGEDVNAEEMKTRRETKSTTPEKTPQFKSTADSPYAPDTETASTTSPETFKEATDVFEQIATDAAKNTTLAANRPVSDAQRAAFNNTDENAEIERLKTLLNK